MKKKQYYSYSRNNYYFGKLMTVRDFECEQNYFNDKRCLSNKMMTGTGIVYGLGSFLVDNRTVSIDAGVALDYAGREIVVPEPVVRKIDSIDGFEENRDKGEVYLCIEYKENFEETSFSVLGSGQESQTKEEFNRIKEGYRLFFKSKQPERQTLTLDDLFINRELIYQNEEMKLFVKYPKFVNPGKILKVSIELEKSNGQDPVSYSFKMTSDLFKSQDKSESIETKYQESEVSSYKVESKNMYLICDAVSDADAELIIPSQDFSVSVGGNFDKISEDVILKVKVTKKPLRDVILEQYYSKPFEDVVDIHEDQEIYLAKMSVVSNQSTYFIEDFKKYPFTQYLLNNSLLDLLVKSTYYDLPNYVENKDYKFFENNKASEKKVNEKIGVFDSVKSGLEKVDMGLYAKSGKTYYSSEFIHGLGYGDVGVILSVENKNTYVTDDPNTLVFGDSSLFKTEEYSLSIPKVSLGAVVNVDKGTMKIGVKLLEKTSAQSVNVRWWVFRHEEEKKALGEEEVSENKDVTVIVKPNTAQIKPLEQIRLSAEVKGSIVQDVTWSLVEEASGTIDDNGVYTAPAKCGVYEVRATSEKFADKFDSAYIVVTDE